MITDKSKTRQPEVLHNLRVSKLNEDGEDWNALPPGHWFDEYGESAIKKLQLKIQLNKILDTTCQTVNNFGPNIVMQGISQLQKHLLGFQLFLITIQSFYIYQIGLCD